MAGVLGAADPGAPWPHDHHPLELKLKRPPSVPMAKIKIPQPLPVICRALHLRSGASLLRNCEAIWKLRELMM
eukprot:3135839-Amphidinium_carterae.1